MGNGIFKLNKGFVAGVVEVKVEDLGLVGNVAEKLGWDFLSERLYFLGI